MYSHCSIKTSICDAAAEVEDMGCVLEMQGERDYQSQMQDKTHVDDPRDAPHESMAKRPVLEHISTSSVVPNQECTMVVDSNLEGITPTSPTRELLDLEEIERKDSHFPNSGPSKSPTYDKVLESLSSTSYPGIDLTRDLQSVRLDQAGKIAPAARLSAIPTFDLRESHPPLVSPRTCIPQHGDLHTLRRTSKGSARRQSMAMSVPGYNDVDTDDSIPAKDPTWQIPLSFENLETIIRLWSLTPAFHALQSRIAENPATELQVCMNAFRSVCREYSGKGEYDPKTDYVVRYESAFAMFLLGRVPHEERWLWMKVLESQEVGWADMESRQGRSAVDQARALMSDAVRGHFDIDDGATSVSPKSKPGVIDSIEYGDGLIRSTEQDKGSSKVKSR